MFHYVSTKISFKHTWMTLRGKSCMFSTGGTLGEIPKKSYEVIVAAKNAFTEATEDVTFSFSLSILVFFLF